LTELGLTVVDSPLDPEIRATGEPEDLENERKVVALPVSQYLYSKVQERRGEIWDADFLDTAISYRKDMIKLNERYDGQVDLVRVKKNRRSEEDSEEEEDEEDYSEPDKVEVNFWARSLILTRPPRSSGS